MAPRASGWAAAVFDAQPLPTLVMDPGFTIRAVNTAYLEAVDRSEDELVDVAMFDAFPDNPEDPEADGVANLSRSLETAARRRLPHSMLVQRYDLRDCEQGGWLPRLWSPVNTPVIDDGRVVGLVHQVQDITPVQADLEKVLTDYRDLVADAPSREGAAPALRAQALAAKISELAVLAEEVVNLRRALSSRASIEQAKGIVMADRRCSPEEAFGILAKLSQDANVRVADVALALVYQAQAAA